MLTEYLFKIDWKRGTEELNVNDSWNFFNEQSIKAMNDNI